MTPPSSGARRGETGDIYSKLYLTFHWLRYDYCKDQLTPYLKKVGFNPAKDIHFLPCSGLTGAGIKNPVGAEFPSYT